ncbi:MAG: DUF6473 family protein, partial [Ruegeria sp.]
MVEQDRVNGMSYHLADVRTSAEPVCTYGPSTLRFRSPKRSLRGVYLACVGGDETFGRFVDQPFPALLEARLDRKCVNFGSLFCGLEALMQDETLLNFVNQAEVCVLQVPGLLGQSNRFYRVHPRRNDRVLAPTHALTALYPEVDFTDVHFVGHLIAHLQSHADARFELFVSALRSTWLKNISALLQRIAPPVILLWLRPNGEFAATVNLVKKDPVVDTAAIDDLRPYCADIVELAVRASGDSDELEDLLFGTLQQPMAEHVIGPATHR